MKCFFIITALWLPLLGFTQILNVDKADTLPYSKKVKTTALISSGLEIDKQQKTLYDATNTGEAMLQKNKHLFIGAASYRFTYNGPDDILNAGFFHLRYRYGYKQLWQPEPFIQYQWDNKRGIQYRFLTGTNARYNLLRSKKWDLNAALGLMYEEEKWNYNGVDSSKIPAYHPDITNKLVKLNSYIRFDWKVNENSELTVKFFIQTGFASFKPRIAPLFQWDVNAGKHLAFSINFSGLYDEAPVVPIDKFYYSLSNSIIFKL